MGLFLYLVAVAFFTSLPVERLLFKMIASVRQIDAKLIKPRNWIFLSKAPFIYAINPLLNFLKGFLSLYWVTPLIESEYMTILIVLVALVLHNWCIWNHFENRRNFGWILLGIYTFINPILGIWFAIGFILFSFLFNSFLLGFLINIISIFFAIWIFLDSPIYLLVNMTIFVLVLIANIETLVQYFEGDASNIRKSFQNR